MLGMHPFLLYIIKKYHYKAKKKYSYTKQSRNKSVRYETKPKKK